MSHRSGSVACTIKVLTDGLKLRNNHSANDTPIRATKILHTAIQVPSSVTHTVPTNGLNQPMRLSIQSISIHEGSWGWISSSGSAAGSLPVQQIYDRLTPKSWLWKKAVVLWNRLHAPADRSKTVANGDILSPQDPKSSTGGKCQSAPYPGRENGPKT